MAVITVYGKTPDVGSAAFVAPNATLAGDVVLAAGSSVWYGAVVRGDTGAIRIGQNSNIQDNAVLHTGPNLGVTIGKNVSIGHSAVVHGCTVGDGALIGMHATVMNGAVVGKNAVVAGFIITRSKNRLAFFSVFSGTAKHCKRFCSGIIDKR